MTAAQVPNEPYLYVPAGERGTALLTSPSGESIVVVCEVQAGVPYVMIATPDGRRIETDGWKLVALRSSADASRRACDEPTEG